MLIGDSESCAGIVLFFNLSRKSLAGMNLLDFRCQSFDNILARALGLGERPQWPVTG
jgi:hypothetical protein